MPFRLAPSESRCPFCDYLAHAKEEIAVVADNEHAVAFVNLRQYERGAMLVIPRQHRVTILDIADSEIASCYQLAKRVAAAAASAFGACGANVFQNNGIKAGQHVPHFHVHVVPRYESSDPGKLFLQQQYDTIPIEEQRAIAAAIRAAL
jgi:histidine triad (HIT) family protein